MVPATVATSIFNQPGQVAEGWYWVVPAAELAVGAVRAVRVLGRDLVVWRGQDGVAHVMDAWCPHMGAHLGEGRVDGNGLRCFFHDWKFDAAGACVDIPCQERPVAASVRAWPTAEGLGLVWVWTGPAPRCGLPHPPELAGVDVDARVAHPFEKACHPNVVMINAIDAQHFNSVHQLPVKLVMEREVLSEQAVVFANTTRVASTSLLTRLIGRFYAGPLTYAMSYWFGSTGTVTLGPDFLHFYILFALRLGEGGKTEGQTVLLTRRRPGPLGWALNRVLLLLTGVVGDYFAVGDTRVFQTIRFDFRTPIKADAAIVGFIRHVEAQPVVRFGTWEPVGPVVAQEPAWGS